LTATPKVRKQAKRELNVRQAQVLTYLALGKRVREIAELLGVSDDSIRRDMRRLDETKTRDNRLEIELEKHRLLWNKSLACIEGNLDHGNLKAAEDVLKYTGVWTDRLEVTAKVDPDDQQKKMMENMEALLKLSKGKVQGALPEKTEEELRLAPGEPTLGTVSCVEKTGLMEKLEIAPEEMKPGAMIHVDKDGNRVKTTETETQSQLGACTCDFGHSAMGDPVNIDPKCPVHGDKKQAIFTNPKSPRYAQIVDLPSGKDGDKDKDLTPVDQFPPKSPVVSKDNGKVVRFEKKDREQGGG